MRVLRVTPFLTRARGGTVTSLTASSRFLSERGHEVTIVTTDFERDDSLTNQLRGEGIEVVPFHCVVNVGLLLLSPSLRGWLKTNVRNYDIIHMHNFRTYQNYVVHRFALDAHVPYIVQAHGSVLPMFEKRGLKRAYDLFCGRRMLQNASRVIAVTPAEESQYRRMGVTEGKITLVPNGIDSSEYEFLPERGAFRRRYSIEPQEKVILYLGRLHRIKGVDMLVLAFSRMMEYHKNARLVIVGPDDGMLAALRRQARNLGIHDRVVFADPHYGRSKLEAYVDSDICVLPSIYEVFGLTILEAMACGTPVIATEECGLVELVRRYGHVVKRDPNSLCDSMIDVLMNLDSEKKTARESRKHVLNEFGWNNIITRMEDVYEDCVRHP